MRYSEQQRRAALAKERAKTKKKTKPTMDESLYAAGLYYDKERQAYKMDINADEMYTVFTKAPGEDLFSEEIDVLVGGFGPGARGKAMEIARRVIKWGFDPILEPVEVVHRPKGIMFY